MEVRGDGDERIESNHIGGSEDGRLSPTHRCTKNGVHGFRAHLFLEHFVHGVHHAEGADSVCHEGG